MHHATINRILTYRRVAASDQTSVGNSLDAQRETLARYAASLHLPIVLEFVEVASGAGSQRALRVEQERLLDVIVPGDLLAVTTLDRLARNCDVVRRQVVRILNKGGRFACVAEGEFDHSPAGQLKLSILTFLALEG
jgi:DNA invertase Pin-like site-specific DNA recombinase